MSGRLQTIVNSTPGICAGYPAMSEFLKTRLVSEDQYRLAHRETGSVYFILNARDDTIKIGHSRDPLQRLGTLQVANSSRLELIGLIAAPIAAEKLIHFWLSEGRIGGEWFWDRGVTTARLLEWTHGEPLRRNVWLFVRGRTWYGTPDGVKHYWNEATASWEPPLE